MMCKITKQTQSKWSTTLVEQTRGHRRAQNASAELFGAAAGTTVAAPSHLQFCSTRISEDLTSGSSRSPSGCTDSGMPALDFQTSRPANLGHRSYRFPRSRECLGHHRKGTPGIGNVDRA